MKRFGFRPLLCLLLALVACRGVMAQPTARVDKRDLDFVANGVATMQNVLKARAKERGLENPNEDQIAVMQNSYRLLRIERAMLNSAMRRMPAESSEAKQIADFLAKWDEESIADALEDAPNWNDGLDAALASLARTFRQSNWRTPFPLFRP